MNETQKTEQLLKEWNKRLAEEGLPEELPKEDNGTRVRLGDGLGNKTDAEEDLEDSNLGHSRMCPINLGHGLNDEINQPADRPVEKSVLTE